MNTPIYDFVSSYIKKDLVRAHMPGHKGKIGNEGISAVYPYDITEICGADALFEADGIIAESEKNAAELFHTNGTFYSAGGSTLCIQAMLAMTSKDGDKVIAARNSHKAFINSCILLNLDPVWIYPEFENGSVIAGKITAENVRNALEANPDAVCVYITSPDYLGNTADIAKIAKVAHSFKKPLLVDNAHGAHLAFMDEPMHPIQLGADICCDSAHKTLPVLTGGAYLHTASKEYTEKAKEAMSVFGSSSPSYLILESLDLCNRYLEEYFRYDLKQTEKKVNALKKSLSDVYHICDSEPLKLTLYTLPNGKTGYETAEYLRHKKIEPEYADRTHVMLMFSPFNKDTDFERIYEALYYMPMPKIRLDPPDFKLIPPARKMSPREAYFSESENVPTEKALGRICAKAKTVCPPCVPAAVGGEILDENCIKILKMYSISEINVVK